MDWYLKVLKQYTRFHGRARRKEYWYFYLINFLITIVLLFLDRFILRQTEGIGFLLAIYTLGVLLPSIAVAIRRLHDIGKSGWWYLINFIPLIGGLIFLYFTVLDSEPGQNKFGRNPKESALE